MKSQRVGIFLVGFILVAGVIFTQLLIRQEKKTSTREIKSKGNQIVSLIALHSIDDFEGDKHDFFIKTLMEYTSYQGLFYCFINDGHGTPIVSLEPGHSGSEIPNHIRTKSLAAMGLTCQSFKTMGSGQKVLEFAKPIFENGEKTGTVRIGLKPPFIPIFSMERINLLAVVLFFVVSAVIIVYYGFVKALKPLEQFSAQISNDGSSGVSSNTSKGLGVVPMMDAFEKAIVQFKKQLAQIEISNQHLASKIGVLKFEKSRIIHILNSIHFGIIITDTKNNVNYINDYMLKLLNTARTDAMDRPLAEILQQPEITSFISQQEGLEHLGTNSHIDTSFDELAPGETFRVSCSYIRGSEKSVIGKMILFNDITREKAAEKATLEFSAYLSHELITPLTTIKSYSEMLMDGEIQDSETQKEFYNTINSETARLSRLIKDLLNLSKIELGGLVLNKGLVKSDWLFNDCITAVEGAARQKNIAIQKYLPDNFPSLIGDKDQLKGALINILGNAVKYTPAKGEIHFALKEENKMVVFDIKDTGYGMSEEDLSHIFDKFYRSGNAQIMEQQGTGLGLAITSQIISLHDGEIKVQSELGKGTRFIVKIPKGTYYLGKK